jgi:hypothetical protein
MIPTSTSNFKHPFVSKLLPSSTVSFSSFIKPVGFILAYNENPNRKLQKLLNRSAVSLAYLYAVRMQVSYKKR